MGGLIRYLFIFVMMAFILFFFFKTMKETKIYQSKRWRQRVKGFMLLVLASVVTTALVLGTYIHFFERVR